MRRFLIAAALGLCASAGPAVANDSSAELGAGGLHFERTNAVSMVSEDLYLSMREVRVRYVFRNRTPNPVTLRVAFPLPRLDPDLYESPVDIADPENANFVRFRTSVDGRPIPLEVEQRATVNGRDVTAQLRAANVPLLPLAQATNRRLLSMPAAQRSALTRAGLVEFDTSGTNETPQYARPLWALETTFHRLQTFAPGRDVVVEHRYTPVAGGSVMSMLLIDDIPRTNPDRVAMTRQYCIDAAFETAAQRLRQRFGPERVQEGRLAYILRTGANWAGPIGRFRLTVDKGAADNLVSFCGQGVRRTSLTTFEINRTNFTPTEDLQILFLIPSRD